MMSSRLSSSVSSSTTSRSSTLGKINIKSRKCFSSRWTREDAPDFSPWPNVFKREKEMEEDLTIDRLKKRKTGKELDRSKYRTTAAAVSKIHNTVLGRQILEPLPDLKPISANPLTSFPSKSQSIAKSYFSVRDVAQHTRDVEKRSRWLDPLKIDPHFGLKGSTQEDEIRRAFRRVESSALFVHPRKDDVKLEELYQPSKFLGSKTAPLISRAEATTSSSLAAGGAGSGAQGGGGGGGGTNSGKSSTSNVSSERSEIGKYVLVQENRLEELTRFEDILRDEREKLGQQCAWLLNDFSADARIPLPATRLAIQNLCEEEMKRLRSEMIKLNSKWDKFSRQNHYNKPHLFLDKDSSFFRGGPLEQKALKLKLAREAAETWRIRKERDSMSYEDDSSYLTERYLNAQIRFRDYEKYYILATRYGIMSAEVFNKDNRPGRRYWIHATRAVLMFQAAWDRYWAVHKLRRYRASRRIQAGWRRRWCMKRVLPIINLHRMYSKRTYYRFCFLRWIDYNRFCRNIRESIAWWLVDYRKMCFNAWKTLVVAKQERRQYVMRRFLVFLKNASLWGRFARWIEFTRKRQRGRRFFKRIIKYPHFGLWLDFVKEVKDARNLYKCATVAQSVVRMFVRRRHFLRMKHAVRVLEKFGRVASARHRAGLRRTEIVKNEFNDWLPAEIIRRAVAANDKERTRLSREQQTMLQKEKEEKKNIKKFFATVHGLVQLREMVLDKLRRLGKNTPFFGPRPEELQATRKALVERCCSFTRQLEQHDFCSTNPPFIKCPNPKCRAIFTTEDQYISHMKTAFEHRGKPPQFAQFHLLLRNPKAVEIFRVHMISRLGYGSVVNCIDAWLAIQDWRKTLSASEGYHVKGIAIYELYLDKIAPRPLNVDTTAIQPLLQALEVARSREYKGFYQGANAHPNFIRRLLRMPGQFYEKWTDEQIVPPDAFDDVEWKCFMNLFDAYEASFVSSEDDYRKYQQILEEETEKKRLDLLADYTKVRSKRFYEDALDMRRRDQYVEDLALEVANKCLESEATYQATEIAKRGAQLAAIDVMCEEQKKHEPIALLTDDALFWAEEPIIEEFYDFYVKALLKTMWAMPEMQQGMLQYAGLVKAKRRTSLQNLLQPKKEKQDTVEWFQDFMKSAKEEEKQHMPPTHDQAAMRIQRRFRGNVCRSVGRKLFTSVYTKRYDPNNKLYYYANLRTGESMWDRPRLLKRLYPKSNW